MTDGVVSLSQSAAKGLDWARGAPVVSRPIRNVKDMVLEVKCGSRKGQIDRLIVMSHGVSQGDTILIGSDSLSSGTISQYAKHLGELAPYFSKGGYAHFQSCFVGMHSGKRSVLLELAKLFRVPVFGGTGEENPVLHFNMGGYVVGLPCGRLMPAPRPQFGL
jgi:hypothetical protein